VASKQELLGNPASVGVWNVDRHRSTIGFKAKSMWGLAPVKGRFTEFRTPVTTLWSSPTDRTRKSPRSFDT
jgi:polyisoprenoid-binding protein YceI